MKLHRSDNINLGVALCPSSWDGEFFGVNRIGACGLEGLHCPLSRLVERWRTWNAPANFVGEDTQVLLQGSGRLEGLLHDGVVGLRKAGHGAGQQQRRDEKSNPAFAHNDGNYTQGPAVECQGVTKVVRTRATIWRFTVHYYH